MDEVRRGVEWLQQYRHRKLTETCRYVQNGNIYENVKLTLAQDASMSDDDTGVIFNVRQLDFLASPGEFAEKDISPPMRGDRIIRDLDTEQIEYEVVGTSNEPAYRPMSRYRLGWRIHAQILKIGTVA